VASVEVVGLFAQGRELTVNPADGFPATVAVLSTVVAADVGR
jgi:hypothetical protein